MNFMETKLEGLFTVDLNFHNDERGWFGRTFCEKEFNSIGFSQKFVQLNHSYNAKKGTLRGMHFQNPPFGETKLIRCIKGKVFDVAVDLRINSPSFLNWYGIELSSKNKKMILIPSGFAHGFITLEDHSELLYHHTEFYNQSADNGFIYDDQLININWPEAIRIISPKDKKLPTIKSSFQGI